MTIAETELLAWLDGELDDTAVEAVEQAIRADPALMARAEVHFLTMMRLRDAFSPLLDAPLPPEIAKPAGLRAAGASTTETIDDIASANEGGQAEIADGGAVGTRARPSLGTMLWRWGLPVLLFALGVLIGHFIFSPKAPETSAPAAETAPPAGGNVRDHDGTLIAAGPLAAALADGLKGDDAAPVRIALSFRDKTGRLCRSFDTTRLAGIACRDDDGWRLRLALQTSGGNRSGSSESPFVGQAIDAMIAGDPLDAGEERAARDRGWR